jgi:magnesium transporter
MSPVSSLTVPSPLLLRFLRAQCRDLPFFDPSHGVIARDSKILSHAIARDNLPAKIAPRLISRTFGTPQPRRDVILQAGLFDLENLISRSPRKRRQAGRDIRPELKAPIRALRHASTEDGTPEKASSQNLQGKFWGTALHEPLKPDEQRPQARVTGSHDRDEDDTFFNSRQMRAKAAAEPRIRCTEVDENGEVIMVDGEFKKSELIAKVWRSDQLSRFNRM